MTAPARVCAHVKRGICPTCSNPTAPAKAEKRHYITPFGAALLAAGKGKLPRLAKKHTPRHPRNTAR